MKARIAGTELNYDVQGRGPALLCLHAFPLDSGMWSGVASALRELYQVVRFDARGFGGTPPGDGALSMERIADDGVALLDHLGISRAVVMGSSMGGYAAFAFQRRQATRLRGLVLCDTRAAADSDEARQSRAKLAEEVRKRGAAAAAEAFGPRLLGQTTQRERPQVVSALHDRIMGASPQGIVDGLMGLAARADSTGTLREIRVPTLIVCGEEDVLTPPADARALHEGIAGSRLELVPGAGHLPMLEDPPAFETRLRDFLGRLDERS